MRTYLVPSSKKMYPRSKTSARSVEPPRRKDRRKKPKQASKQGEEKKKGSFLPPSSFLLLKHPSRWLWWWPWGKQGKAAGYQCGRTRRIKLMVVGGVAMAAVMPLARSLAPFDLIWSDLLPLILPIGVSARRGPLDEEEGKRRRWRCPFPPFSSLANIRPSAWSCLLLLHNITVLCHGTYWQCTDSIREERLCCGTLCPPVPPSSSCFLHRRGKREIWAGGGTSLQGTK